MTARRILFTFVSLLIAVLAVRTPQLARPGLDAAWSLALSVAHTNHLVYGRDIAFTFGPLGYLVIGVPTAAVIGDIGLFSAFIGAVYAISTYIAISAPMSNVQRVALAFTLICLAASPSGGDYLLLFAFLAALGSRSMRTPRRLIASAIVLGALAGIAAMTKFTLAIDCGGAAALFYGASIVLAPAVHRIRWVAAAVIFGSAFTSAVLVSDSPNIPTFGIAFIVLVLSLAACWGSDRRRLSLAVVALAACTIATLLLAPTIADFARLSLAEASDYSSAMSQPGPTVQLQVALGEFAIVALAVTALAFEGNVPLAAALGFALFGGFKHGFVRQDGHVFYFAITAAAVCAVAYAAIRRPGSRRVAFVAFIASTIALFTTTQSALGLSVLGGIAPASIANSLHFLTTLRTESILIDANNALALAGERLPQKTIARFGRAPVDIEPYDSTVAIASGLNWKPVPGLQAYSAYDRPIDDANVASIVSRDQGFVLFSLYAIDGRYPFSDSPQMMVALACRYRSDGTVASTEVGGPAVILRGPGPDRCKPLAHPENRIAHFEEEIPIAHRSDTPSEFARLAIHTRYSATGRFRKAVFRVGDLFMTLKYDDGTNAKFRIVPEAAAIGMIIEPSPRTFEETRALFTGTLLSHVRSVVVTTDVPSTFDSTFDVWIEHAVRRP